VPDHYDDGGISGGTLERPALQRLLSDIEADRVDVVVVYKIDRLSRSLMHFAKLVETFDAHSVTFVSVTQSFSTTTSMGRLTLNILLSFAQFEREVIGERVRDKIAASRARGMWMGGSVPLGYDVRERKLVVNDTEAAAVRRVFEGFIAIGSAMRLIPVLREEGVLTKTGRSFDKGSIYKLLHNRTYVGQVVHKGNVYPGEHQAIVSQELWDRVHTVMQGAPRTRGNQNRRQTPALLRGLIFGPAPTRGGDRGRRNRSGPGAAAPARGGDRHVAGGAGRCSGPDRVRDSGGAGAAGPALGGAVPCRAGADRPAAGRTGGRQSDWRGHPAAAGRTGQPDA
jgi:DNA invertase Pin-like site-specific DNA recombinase